MKLFLYYFLYKTNDSRQLLSPTKTKLNSTHRTSIEASHNFFSFDGFWSLFWLKTTFNCYKDAIHTHRWPWRRLIGNKMAKTDAFQGRLNSRSGPRTMLVAKTPTHKCSHACLFAGRPWPFAGITSIPWGRASDQIKTFSCYNLPEIPTILSSAVFSILRGEFSGASSGFLPSGAKSPAWAITVC